MFHVKLTKMFKGSGNKSEVVNSPDKLNRLVEGTQLKGEIRTDSNFRLDGELIGNMNTLGKLVIGPSGKIEGDVICGNADIEGEIVGNIKVDGILILKSTAKITGNIAAKKLGIEEGAAFTGNCNMGASAPEIVVPPVNVNENESQLVY